MTAILELCDLPAFDCGRMVVCVERDAESRSLMRDLGWVGFEPVTLEEWDGQGDITSHKWVFLGMDI